MTIKDLRVTLTHDPTELTRLREAWQALEHNSASITPYMSWEWVSLLWKHFGHEGQLWLLQARDAQDRLVGVAPLMLREYQPVRGLKWRKLDFVSAVLECDHLDFIVERGVESTVSLALWQTIAAQRGAYDVASFSSLPESSPTLTMLRQQNVPWQEYETNRCPFVPLPADWETYFAGLSKGKRKEQRRLHRQLDEAFPQGWTWHMVTQPQELDRCFDDLVHLHQAKWQALGQLGAFGTPSALAFHREVSRVFLEKGWLRLLRLCVGNRLAATIYTFCHMGRVYDFASGLDMSFADYSPGEVLTGLSLKYAIETGDQEYDLLRGEQDYKLRWGAQVRQDVTLRWIASRRAQRETYALKAAADAWRGVKRVLPQDLRRTMRRYIKSDARG